MLSCGSFITGVLISFLSSLLSCVGFLYEYINSSKKPLALGGLFSSLRQNLLQACFQIFFISSLSLQHLYSCIIPFVSYSQINLNPYLTHACNIALQDKVTVLHTLSMYSCVFEGKKKT